MEDGDVAYGAFARAFGDLGIRAEALSAEVERWEGRLIGGGEADLAQQAAHIRGLLALAAGDLDDVAARLAESAAGEDGAGSPRPLREAARAPGAGPRHPLTLRRVHLRAGAQAAGGMTRLPAARWRGAAVLAPDAGEPTEVDVLARRAEAAFERRLRPR